MLAAIGTFSVLKELEFSLDTCVYFIRSPVAHGPRPYIVAYFAIPEVNPPIGTDIPDGCR
jgi:hypothetical protein